MATSTLPIQLSAQLTTHLTSKSLPPDPTWLSNFLAATRPGTPLPALQRTALFRLLTSDITTSLSATSSHVLPADIHSVQIRERRVEGPVAVQVLDIEDVGRSCWSQVEAIEAGERGETTRGREVIRVVPSEDGEDPSSTSTSVASASLSSGPHKLLLQDARGTRVYGLEISAVDKIGLGMDIGAKLVLRGVLVARGCLLLEPRSVEVLGGKVEAWHSAWKEGRKEGLMRKAKIGERV
ncbi:hypothetical protein BJ546DRAFT_1025034 [Cryomyces antarcticus]|nr:hypothetical protein LTR04_004787 [Oleoguttula sp. CCFEE 6159]